MKRFFILTFMLCCCMLQGFAQAYYTDMNGVRWDFDVSSDGTARLTSAVNYGAEVVVPEKVSDGTTEYPTSCLYNTFCSSNIKKVTLPKVPITIDGAFESCQQLSEVINSDYITACYNPAFEHTNISSIDLSNCEYVHGFYDCQNLETVTLKKCKTIIAEAFINCAKLKSLGETSSVTEVGAAAFSGCSSLISINLSNCTTWGSGWSMYGSIFKDCSNLKEVIIPESMTEISDEFFQGCSSLTSFDFSHITKIGRSSFDGCQSLAKIDLPVCTEIDEYAFKECSNLTEVNLPICTRINGCAFYDCLNLSSIKIPASTYIGRYAFIGCHFSELNIPDKISYIGDNPFGNIEKVIINATKVPSFDGGLEKNTIIFVPKVSLELYKNAENWKDYAGQIFASDGDTQTEFDVRTTAQANAPGLLQQLDRDKLNNIVTLKVSGTINGYDIMLFRNKMDNLHHLDLSDADIVANPYEYIQGHCTRDNCLDDDSFSGLDKLISVKLPKSVKYINKAIQDCNNLTTVEMPENLVRTYDAFVRCSNLKNIIFHNCDSIDYNTFYNCYSLSEITLPQNLKYIGEQAFYNCSNLKNIVLPNNVEFLGREAFYDCNSLESVQLSTSLKEISSEAFYGCSNLKTVQFPPSLEVIGSRAFQDCSSLDNISLPALSHIEEFGFSNCKNLKELKVPSTLESIGDYAFTRCSLEKVYAYTVLPINIGQTTFDNFQNIALYVPTQSVDNYYLNTQWSQFKEIHEFDEPYTYFYLDKEFTLEKRFDGTPDIDIKEDGGLKVDGKDNQEAGDVTIKGDGDKGNSGTLITDGNLNAKMMRFDISVTANKWYFFSFPFDINMANVKAPGEYKWKRYDGKIRSDQGSGGWVDLASNEEWLKQGDGYIFQTNQEGILTLRVTKEKFGQLDATNIMKPLDAYPSGNIADASWNFIGNPQTSYFNVNDLGYDAPITVWNGNSYEAVRPGDDDYTLHPFQAFFVQKPAETSGIEFKAEDRLTKTGSQIRAQETKARRLARGVMPSRLIINLNVTDGTQTDKTRVVFNNQKSRDYEIDCDAAKFMTMGNAPQLYSVEGKGTQYAINERPMGSVQLGFTAKKAGTFTISAARMDQPMLLEDKQAGITFDLTNGDYEFTSGAGTFNSRFMLIPSRGTTGIADIVSKTGVSIMPTEEGLYINGTNGKSVQVFNLNGIEVANRSTDGMLNLATGVYIVKVNGMSTKVMVK